MDENNENIVKEKKQKKGSPIIIILAVLLIMAAAVLALSMFAPDTFDAIAEKVSAVFSIKNKAPRKEELDDPVFSVYSYEIDPDEYRYYILYYKMACEDQDPDYWENHPEEKDEVKTYVYEQIVNNYDLVYWAEYEGFKLADITDEEYQAKYDEFRAEQEAEMEFDDYLTIECLTPAVLEKILKQQIIRDKLVDYVYSEESTFAQVTDEEMQSYFDEADGYATKHILILHGADDTEDAEKKALAESILERLNDGEDFDMLMNEYSEDPGLVTYSNGYVGTKGDMVEEYENSARALEVGKISGIVETDFGYHIIKRINPTLDMIYEQIGTGPIVNYRIAQTISDLDYIRYLDNGPNYDSIDISKLYNPFKEAIDEIKSREAEQ